MTGRRSQLLFFTIAIVAVFAGALLARSVFDGRRRSPALSSGTLLQPARPVSKFNLTDQNAGRFDESRLLNRWTLMFFGFTNCGDVCPTTLAMLSGVSKSLVDLPEALRPQIVFVSVDAKRDTPLVVKEYLRHFDPAFVGVTGTQADLNAFTLSLGVPSSIRPLASGYAVDHSASILAFNPRGEFQALFSAPHVSAALSSDYRALIGMQL